MKYTVKKKIYDFRYLAISTERFYNYYIYILKSVDRFSIGDVWLGHNVEGMISTELNAAKIREILGSCPSPLFKKSHFFELRMRDWLVKEKRKFILVIPEIFVIL